MYWPSWMGIILLKIFYTLIYIRNGSGSAFLIQMKNEPLFLYYFYHTIFFLFEKKTHSHSFCFSSAVNTFLGFSAQDFSFVWCQFLHKKLTLFCTNSVSPSLKTFSKALLQKLLSIFFTKQLFRIFWVTCRKKCLQQCGILMRWHACLDYLLLNPLPAQLQSPEQTLPH